VKVPSARTVVKYDYVPGQLVKLPLCQINLVHSRKSGLKEPFLPQIHPTLVKFETLKCESTVVVSGKHILCTVLERTDIEYFRHLRCQWTYYYVCRFRTICIRAPREIERDSQQLSKDAREALLSLSREELTLTPAFSTRLQIHSFSIYSTILCQYSIMLKIHFFI
jgi:hypothetical protein